jgi:hypothetical protein
MRAMGIDMVFWMPGEEFGSLALIIAGIAIYFAIARRENGGLMWSAP